MSHFKTIDQAVENVLIKEKKSKFIGFAFPIFSIEDAKEKINQIKKKHTSANHHCYAYEVGINSFKKFRYNDDGEPNNSAGLPIHRQIQSLNITNTLVIIVRYFGGVKLGVGGLINAYKNSAKETLGNCNIKTVPITLEKQLIFDYSSMNIVMRIVKKYRLKIIEQDLANNCKIKIQIKEEILNDVLNEFKDYPKIKF